MLVSLKVVVSSLVLLAALASASASQSENKATTPTNSSSTPPQTDSPASAKKNTRAWGKKTVDPKERAAKIAEESKLRDQRKKEALKQKAQLRQAKTERRILRQVKKKEEQGAK